MAEKLTHIIESLLFVSRRPLSMDRIRSVVSHAKTADIKKAISELNEEYNAREGGFHLVEAAGGYQLRTRPQFKVWIKLLNRPDPLRLSKAALETLSVIAYKQPLIRNDVEFIRGVDSGGVIRSLLDLKLIRVTGRKDIPGRPLIYGTTKYFLEIFELKDIGDLPTLKEIDELNKSR